MADILGIILQAIGGEKLKQVSTVFAEGMNITRQLGGGIGANSIMNFLPSSITNVFNSSGLMGIMNINPVANSSTGLSSTLSSAATSVGAMMTTTTTSSGGSGGNSTTTTTTSPTYPLFTAALTQAVSTMNSFYYTSKLLAGQSVPNYDNNEYGLTDVMRVSSSGLASLNDLVSPLMINSTLMNAATSLQTLLNTVQSQSISDSAAVSALNTIMTPIIASITTSQNAYNSGTTSSSSNVVLSEIFSYLDGSGSPENNLVASLTGSQIANQVIAVNSSQSAIAQGNRAGASPETIERAKYHTERLKLIRHGQFDNPLVNMLHKHMDGDDDADD